MVAYMLDKIWIFSLFFRKTSNGDYHFSIISLVVVSNKIISTRPLRTPRTLVRTLVTLL